MIEKRIKGEYSVTCKSFGKHLFVSGNVSVLYKLKEKLVIFPFISSVSIGKFMGYYRTWHSQPHPQQLGVYFSEPGPENRNVVRKVVNDFNREIVQKEVYDMAVEQDMADTALVAIDLRDERLAGHVELIKRRNDLVSAEMVKLAKELFTVSLYTKTPTVVLQNCKLTIQLRRDTILEIGFYLKKVGRQDTDKLTWQNLLNSMAAGRYNRKQRSRKQRSQAVGSFQVSEAWKLVSKHFGNDLIKLLPAARTLVNERLDELRDEAKDDIDYIESAADIVSVGV